MEVIAWLSLLVASVATGAAVWLAFVGQRQVKMGQQQLAVSQEQVRQSLEALYDNRRPILVPTSPLPLLENGNRKHFDFQQASCPLTVRNVGSGIALNVRAVIHPPKPDGSPSYLTSRQTLWLGIPVDAGESVETETRVGMTVVSGDATIEGESTPSTLYAPPEPSMREMMLLDTAYIVGRLTMTYHDVYGRKHASVFDFTDLGLWECVRVVRDIPKDIEDLDHEVREGWAHGQAENAAALDVQSEMHLLAE